MPEARSMPRKGLDPHPEGLWPDPVDALEQRGAAGNVPAGLAPPAGSGQSRITLISTDAGEPHCCYPPPVASFPALALLLPFAWAIKPSLATVARSSRPVASKPTLVWNF